MITSTVPSHVSHRSETSRVQVILKLTYGLVPIVAGLDKFFNILTDWTQYLNPSVAEILPFSPAVFMMIVGIIEIIAGALVLYKTEIGALVVSAWLLLIAISLLVGWDYVDVAVRDIVMAVGAFCLSRLSKTKALETGAA